MTDLNLYDRNNYVEVLQALAGSAKQRTGRRKELAEALNCQPAYLSQILNGRAQISLEQALRLVEHEGWTEEMGDYFLLLVQKDRAGTVQLKNHFQKKVTSIQKKQTDVSTRVHVTKALEDVEKAQYYSSWLYAGVHIALSIPELRTPEALEGYFGVKPVEIRRVLNFLVEKGLAVEKNNELSIGPNFIHLNKESIHIDRHLTQWRLQGIDKIQSKNKEGLHYSVVYSLSQSDAQRIQKMILQSIEQCTKIIRNSPEEVLYCQSFDWFEIKK